ncbi:LysR family transcriptional regulator [Acidisoma cellulosilytica]|uniref:LysR family transcriptional regulator n=1 Tax=Acidisoma cellulosilyticum TaxID=2802395 RepID=A0A963Z5E0_9PROT|nr:LysR family transcriptional regulator [Acidisoma cellulosilyticum]MCB8882791.1 LysR family transcriptional regulator [Acidisoma cellulosilyticum]
MPCEPVVHNGAMDRDILSGVLPFLAVAEHRSFTRAAAALGVTPTAVSKVVRQLEQRHRVVLFQRTTRSVALTEAGSALLARLRPAVLDMTGALSDLGGYQSQVTGVLRLTMSRTAAQFLAERILPEYRRLYPDVRLDLSINEGTVDLASGDYDAGIRQSEVLERDMLAIRLTPPVRWAVYGSPGYFAKQGRPAKPEDLMGHQTIGYRFVTAGRLYHWEFARDDRSFTIRTRDEILTNDRLTLMTLARAGLGLAYLTEGEAAQAGEGKLEPVLRDWITESPGLFLYFSARMQSQPKLRALLQVIRTGPKKSAGKAAD